MIAYIQKLGAYKEVKKAGEDKPTPLDPDTYRKAAMPVTETPPAPATTP
jgi:hypothetical protein